MPEEQPLVRYLPVVVDVRGVAQRSPDDVDFIAEALAKRDLGESTAPASPHPTSQQDEDWAARCRDSPAVQKATTAFSESRTHTPSTVC